MIVDAQVHIWGSGTPTNLSHRQVPSFTKDELLKEMDEAGVDAAVIHPPSSWDPNANELAVEAARQHPKRLAILGNFPLDRPESRSLVDGWKQRPGMLGLRFTFLQPHQKSWPTDGTMDWLWPAAERAGLPIALLAASFMPLVGQIAERHPRLKLIIDHLGRLSGSKDDAAWASLPEMLADVTTVQLGDHVVACLSGFCGSCAQGLGGHPNLCVGGVVTRAESAAPRLSQQGRPLRQFVGISSYAERMLPHENSIVKIDPDLPLARAALVGCGVLTGVGAALRTSGLEAGQTVAVFGCGGVGLHVPREGRDEHEERDYLGVEV